MADQKEKLRKAGQDLQRLLATASLSATREVVPTSSCERAGGSGDGVAGSRQDVVQLEASILSENKVYGAQLDAAGTRTKHRLGAGSAQKRHKDLKSSDKLQKMLKKKQKKSKKTKISAKEYRELKAMGLLPENADNYSASEITESSDSSSDTSSDENEASKGSASRRHKKRKQRKNTSDSGSSSNSSGASSSSESSASDDSSEDDQEQHDEKHSRKDDAKESSLQVEDAQQNSSTTARTPSKAPRNMKDRDELRASYKLPLEKMVGNTRFFRQHDPRDELTEARNQRALIEMKEFLVDLDRNRQAALEEQNRVAAEEWTKEWRRHEPESPLFYDNARHRRPEGWKNDSKAGGVEEGVGESSLFFSASSNEKSCSIKSADVIGLDYLLGLQSIDGVDAKKLQPGNCTSGNKGSTEKENPTSSDIFAVPDGSIFSKVFPPASTSTSTASGCESTDAAANKDIKNATGGQENFPGATPSTSLQ
ncbi:unnamed protein product, partial [Amoebophrya sp. A120]|eukprot:GSA120T00012553001.1